GAHRGGAGAAAGAPDAGRAARQRPRAGAVPGGAGRAVPRRGRRRLAHPARRAGTGQRGRSAVGFRVRGGHGRAVGRARGTGRGPLGREPAGRGRPLPLAGGGGHGVGGGGERRGRRVGCQLAAPPGRGLGRRRRPGGRTAAEGRRRAAARCAAPGPAAADPAVPDASAGLPVGRAAEKGRGGRLRGPVRRHLRGRRGSSGGGGTGAGLGVGPAVLQQVTHPRLVGETVADRVEVGVVALLLGADRVGAGGALAVGPEFV